MGYHRGKEISAWQEVREAFRDEKSWRVAQLVTLQGRRITIQFVDTGDQWVYESEQASLLEGSIGGQVEVSDKWAMIAFRTGPASRRPIRVGRVQRLVPREMYEYRYPVVDEWGVLFDLIGAELQRRIRAGEPPRVRDAAFTVGSKFFADDGELDGFVDEMSDHSLDLPSELLISWSWEEGSASVEVVEFGPGHTFVAFYPDENGPDGLNWGIICEADRDDPDVLKATALWNVAYDAGFEALPVPTFISFGSPVTKDDIRAAMEGVLDLEAVREWVEDQTGAAWPLETESQCKKLLDEYCRLTVQEGSSPSSTASGRE